MRVMVGRWRTVATWCVIAALAVAGGTSCNSSSPGCPPGAKCAAGPGPATTVVLQIDDRHYSLQPGQMVTRGPLRVKSGQQFRFGVRIEADKGVRVADVWLYVNRYPGGFQNGSRPHPTDKYRLVLHDPGVLAASQQLTGSWTATSLFDTNSLAVTVLYAVGRHGEGWPVARMTITT